MGEFNKGLNGKIISIIVVVSFLVTTNVYPDTLPTIPPQHLRKQIDFNNKEEFTPRYLRTMLAVKEGRIEGKDDLAQVNKGNVYFNKKAFDELPWKEKMKVVVVGFSVLFQGKQRKEERVSMYFITLGLIYFLFRYAKNQKEYCIMAKEAVEQQPIIKPGTGRRIWVTLKRGNVFKAIELFWSGWNPRVTVITSIPVYRWLGGNKSPFLASVGTFTFLGFIVHPYLFLIVGINIVSVIGELLGAQDNIILSNLNRFSFILGGAHILLGVIIGLSKEYRKYKYENYKKGQIESKTVEQSVTISEEFQKANITIPHEKITDDTGEAQHGDTSLVRDIAERTQEDLTRAEEPISELLSNVVGRVSKQSILSSSI